MGLKYRNVFNRYSVSISEWLASFTYSLYKKARYSVSNRIPLTARERHIFEDGLQPIDLCSKMPLGYDPIKNVDEDGVVELLYIDFYDYLPKEDLAQFKRSLRKCTKRNKINTFSPFLSVDRFNQLDDMGRYFDNIAHTELLTVNIEKNADLAEHCSKFSISLRNLSSTFLLVNYRFFINKDFNEKYSKICNTQYKGYNELNRYFNTPWYKFFKFGRSYWTGDNRRSREIYEFVSNVKWGAYKEICKSFKSSFGRDNMFPPSFETYSTNIRPNRQNLNFWDSIMLGYNIDYTSKYNLCIDWSYQNSRYEGQRLAAYRGIEKDDNSYVALTHYEIAKEYAVYIVAHTMNTVGRRDIAVCNKRISSAMRKQRTHKLLKQRLYIEKKLYYIRRFVNEFSGETFINDSFDCRNYGYMKGSTTSRVFTNIAPHVKETCNLINDIVDLSNAAVDYKSSKSNISLQWLMLIITALSLLTAIISMAVNR